ncbi:hypothetical protein TNCV_4806001 [Trichonephila clavipes]|nr:hypothetical protein TNCV_4806001 [Trichonephila clavipes]
MNPSCQQGTVQAGGGSEMVWGMCSMKPLIHLDTTLTSDRYGANYTDAQKPKSCESYTDRHQKCLISYFVR